MENGEGVSEMHRLFSADRIHVSQSAMMACQGLQILYLFSLLVQFLIFTHFSVHARPAPSPGPSSPAPTPPAHKPTPPPHQPPVDPNSRPKQETPPGSKSSSGLSGGQKAGIVIGVFAAAGGGWVGWRIYKKRRGNIRRARFGYQARRDMQL